MPDSAPFTIRPAVVGDARVIAEIGVAGWRAAYAGTLPADFLAGLKVEPRALAWRTRLEMDEEDAPSWVAEAGGRVIGYVSGGPPRDEDVPPPSAEVYAIYVMPGEWRHGVGRALLSTASADLQRRGAAMLVLWVLEANAAGRAFYEAVGWRPDGARQLLQLGGIRIPEVRYRRTTSPS